METNREMKRNYCHPTKIKFGEKILQNSLKVVFLPSFKKHPSEKNKAYLANLFCPQSRAGSSFLACPKNEAKNARKFESCLPTIHHTPAKLSFPPSLTQDWSIFFSRISVKRNLKSILLLFLLNLVVLSGALGQKKTEPQLGTVSFVTSSRIYLKFDGTEAIEPGDTLYVITSNQLIPTLIVDQKSSLSVVGKPIGDHKLSKGDVLQFNGKVIKTEISEENLKKPIVKKKDKIDGRISIANYANISSATDFNTRSVARLRLSADEINDSNFSFDTYLIYRQNLESSESGIFQSPGLFNVYGFSVKYEKADNYSISLGRKINRRVASLGMMDGIHAEKQFGKLHIGGIAGFRPDQQNNSFNSNLMQYGGYLGVSHLAGQKRFEATVGVLEQKNGSAIDRRYLYMQGSASLGFGFSIFSSAEMDLYTLNAEMQESGTQLTNLHISTNYRVSKKVRVSMSYDTRKQIIFYETFQTQLERLIADDEARQGIRARVNVKVTKGLSAGLAYGKRYQSSLDNASDNYNAFATLRNTPIIGGILSGNININQSSYLNSMSTTFRHSRYYFKNKVNASTYLRTVAYSYNPERDVTILQQFVGSSINYRFGKKMTLGGLVEFSLRKAEYKTRVNVQLTKRF